MDSVSVRFVFFALLSNLFSCGDKVDLRNTKILPNQSEDQNPGETPKHETPLDGIGIVKGHWEIPMSSANSQLMPTMFLASHGSFNQPISGTVAPNITFTVSNTNFTTPAASGTASYGSLDVTALSDNQLRVCGTGGTQKCSTANIRVYTTGANGGGLWSDVEGVGLPILSGNNTVGFGSGNAAVAAQVAIANGTQTLKLSNFTGSASLTIPISVNFTDAAAGTYSTTLVVEYVIN